MRVTLVLPHAIKEELRRTALLPLETAGVLLARLVNTHEGDVRLLARAVRWVPDRAYLRREGDSLSISSDGYVPFLAEAEQTSAVALWLHTHPGQYSSPCPSSHDHDVDGQLADLFRLRTGSPYYGALIVSPREDDLAFTGHIQGEDGHTHVIERVWTTGDRFRLIWADGSPARSLSPAFDRSVRAFGGAIQQTLGDLRVGLVGCGGTGSAVAEQLVRLGVRDLLLVDPDRLSASNVTRVYGSTPADVGQLKVEVLAAHLKRIAPDVRCARVQSMITLARSIASSAS